MHLLPEQNPNALQLLLIFTLQVSLTEQEPHTIWAICGNTTSTDPTEAHTYLPLRTFSTGAHKDRSHHTHISSSSKPTFTSKI